MRKAFIIMLALLLLAAGFVAAAAAEINSQRDRVVLSEKVFAGSAEMAEGLEIALPAELDGHLFWDTLVTFGENTAVSTRYDFRSVENSDYPWSRGEHFRLDNTYSGFSWNDENDPFAVITKKLREQSAAEHVEIIETVYIADYYDYYPFAFVLDTAECYFDSMDMVLSTASPLSRAANEFLDFFRIPVLESDAIEISVRTHSTGASYGMGRAPEGDSYQPYAESVFLNGACFFTINNRSTKGTIMDTSLIPGGYGIYRLPYGPHPVDERGVITASGLKTDELEMVYAIDPEYEVCALRADAERGRLLLHLKEGSEYVIHVIESASMECLQRISVIDKSYASHSIIWQRDDLIVINTRSFLDEEHSEEEGQFYSVVALNSDGEYELCFTVSAEEEREQQFHRIVGIEAAAFDGQRLALVSRRGVSEEEYYRNYYSVYNCGFRVMVFDRDGLIYDADFFSSLDTGISEEYTYNCSINDHGNTVNAWPCIQAEWK